MVIVEDAVDDAATKTLREEMKTVDGSHSFGYSEARIAFERIWTQENYEALTEILAGLPVDWRFFVKHKVFEAIERLPESDRTGKGYEVRRAFEIVAAEYSELGEHASTGDASRKAQL